jgi:RimJ/RimL family protein N-acetyltransferase
MGDRQSAVDIRLWSEDDFKLLVRLMGDPAMTVYLGGPETTEQLEKRHQRYCQMKTSDKGHMYVVAFGDQRVGSVGYWEIEWQGQQVWETGWSVVPEFQGKGLATTATALSIERARAEAKHRFMHAFPSVENSPSNAICDRLGFALQGEVEFESWREPGQFLRYNDWRLDLFADLSEPSST